MSLLQEIDIIYLPKKKVGLNFQINSTSSFIYWNNMISMPCISFSWFIDKLLKPANGQLVLYYTVGVRLTSKFTNTLLYGQYFNKPVSLLT